MTNLAYRFLLTISATSLLLIIFAVQKGYTIGFFFDQCTYLVELSNTVSYALYLLIPIFFTGLSIFLSKFLGKDEFKTGDACFCKYWDNFHNMPALLIYTV